MDLPEVCISKHVCSDGIWEASGILEWKEHGPWGQPVCVANLPSRGFYEDYVR